MKSLIRELEKRNGRFALRALIFVALTCGATAFLPCSLAQSSAQTNSVEAAYDQPYRPQVHFSPRQNWTNDPNGLVYFHGEYHLFYQYNPFGDQWGHMSWGHAVSKDLLHWHELPVAIPEQDEVMIFTGSVVVDRDNTSGLCTPGKECLVAVYTGYSKPQSGDLQTQNIAYSRDSGRTWVKYSGNPVLDLHLADFRDPSVSWDEKEHHWVMAVSLPKQHQVLLYSSPNLKAWTRMSEFGPAGDTAGDWECPDLLQIPSLDGKQSLWALKVGLNPGAPQGGSGEQYFLGDFDGKSFMQSSDAGSHGWFHGWTNYGKDDYCAISFNGLPKGQKPVLLGWMSNWQYAGKLPTSQWRGQMSLPRRLSFLHDKEGFALVQEPVVAPLREKPVTISETTLNRAQGVISESSIPPYDLKLTFTSPNGPSFGVRLYSDGQHWTEIGFDTAKREFYIDRTKSSLTISDEFPARTTAPITEGRPYTLELIVDRSSVEAYAQGGTIAMTDLVFPPSPEKSIKLIPGTEKTAKVSGQLWQLRSIWTHVSSSK